MKKTYQGTARAKRVQLQALHAEFENLRMKSGELVSEYFSRTMAIANKMRIHGEKLEDVTIVEKILRSMTVKFNFVVCSIEESKDIDTLSIDELQSSLLVHEQKLSKQDQEEQALQAETKGVWHDRGGSKGKIKHHKSGENKQIPVNFDSEDEGDKRQQATLEVLAEIQNIPDIPQRNQVIAATQLDVAVGSCPQRHRKRPAWMIDCECSNSTSTTQNENGFPSREFGSFKTLIGGSMGKGRLAASTKLRFLGLRGNTLSSAAVYSAKVPNCFGPSTAFSLMSPYTSSPTLNFSTLLPTFATTPATSYHGTI
ncbi:hypothetical protein FEM48_Zijuj04G0028100 [Ziziphus jujuba var. spinosa]|uniref:Retrovirus-related Pol polyprotein from transposon TNT 1-94 n=1 Tax=Ziziphus jujuba var. spinosa TaxID=714518 RepID=A0A978VHE3_ZIZJJ|nr:hypothetical protein FEM48_Zijuj04G0028100 [Ziziphus jujuba var. spinosa]